MKAVIPPRRNRTAQRAYDEDLYKLRHLVENAFLHLKRWRAASPPDTPNMPRHSSPPCKSGASLFGRLSRDDTI